MPVNNENIKNQSEKNNIKWTIKEKISLKNINMKIFYLNIFTCLIRRTVFLLYVANNLIPIIIICYSAHRY